MSTDDLSITAWDDGHQTVMVPLNRKALVPASPERVRELTGFEPGAVAPFGLDRVDLVVMDQRLLLCDYVWVGSGSPTHLARVTPGELVRLSRATTLDLSVDP